MFTLVLSVLCLQFVAKEGDTVTPGTKVAVISKSATSDKHVAPSEEKSSQETHKTSPPEKKQKADEEKPKVEAPIKEKPKTAPVLPKASASEPQLPPKERERRVSFILMLVMS